MPERRLFFSGERPLAAIKSLFNKGSRQNMSLFQKPLRSSSLRSDRCLDNATVGHLSIFTCETSVFPASRKEHQLNCRILNSYEENVFDIGRVNILWNIYVLDKCNDWALYQGQKCPPVECWRGMFGLKELHLHCSLILSGYAIHSVWQKRSLHIGKRVDKSSLGRTAKDVKRL